MTTPIDAYNAATRAAGYVHANACADAEHARAAAYAAALTAYTEAVAVAFCAAAYATTDNQPTNTGE